MNLSEMARTGQHYLVLCLIMLIIITAMGMYLQIQMDRLALMEYLHGSYEDNVRALSENVTLEAPHLYD